MSDGAPEAAPRPPDDDAATAAPTYSVVVPVFRDPYLLAPFVDEFTRVMGAFVGPERLARQVELIFVCDGGGRADEDGVRAQVAAAPFVRGVLLSRNFGQHIALTAGYEAARGRWVAMLNADQQDPIAELPKFFRHAAEARLDLVYGLRKSRAGSRLDRLTSRAFNALLNWLTGQATPLDVATMRVMSRRFVDAYNALEESERYIPGLEQWLGFDVGHVDTVHVERRVGRSSYTLRKRLRMALHSVLGFSDYPLRLVAYAGFALAFSGFAAVVAIVLLKLFAVDFQAGYASLVSIIVSMSGAIIFALGLSSLYLGRILREVQRRPTYVVKERIEP